MHIPPKITHFLWLCSHESLPTKAYLYKLSITPDNLCQICHQEESLQHIFLQCTNAKFLWSQLNILHELECNFSHPTSWIQWLYTITRLRYTPFPNSLPPTIFLPFCLWYLWLTHNSNSFHNLRHLPTPQTIITRASKFFYLTHSIPRYTPKILMYVKWQPPQHGVF